MDQDHATSGRRLGSFLMLALLALAAALATAGCHGSQTKAEAGQDQGASGAQEGQPAAGTPASEASAPADPVAKLLRARLEKAAMPPAVLNPAWHIPDSIAAAEIAPALLRDPAYLQRKGYQIRRGNGAGTELAANDLSEADINQLGKRGSTVRLVQPPGAENALGRYKFVFPNQFDVYLHDTPTGRLFSRSERDFSHGCIRLEKPAELAAYVLDGDARWPPAEVEAALASGRTVTIQLRRPLPVHILYQTAWVDPDGTLEFRPDVYHHDNWLDSALAAETPLWDDLAALRR
jgi:hypothetical protein